MTADINADRAVKGTDSTLDAAGFFRDNMSGSQGLAALRFIAK
jgi:hypothetical protein